MKELVHAFARGFARGVSGVRGYHRRGPGAPLTSEEINAKENSGEIPVASAQPKEPPAPSSTPATPTLPQAPARPRLSEAELERLEEEEQAELREIRKRAQIVIRHPEDS